MKKGISIWSFKPQPLNDVFALAKRAGYDGVELSLDKSGELSMESTEKDLIRIRECAEKHGIELYSVATGLHWDYSLTSEKSEVRNKAKEIIKKQIEVASVLGCNTILTIAGAVGVDFIPDCELVQYDVAYERALEGMRELAPFAEEKKVAIGIENVGNKFLLSPLEMRGFIDEIGSEYVGAYFDVGNILRTGYPEQWIRILGRRVKKIHFKDFKRASNSFVDLMEGNVNFPQVMAALKEIGYDDFVTAEMGPLYQHYPEMILHTTSIAMDEIIR